ncbi:Uncharacterized conserved protein, DUF983 family [Devosia enhydra]|uniref:Uncharacterized conserved protein, DUF983 family n=1 Tax=Devosia enhydra TaxID=665118 RepID=A0A1K2I1B7_9HYPH|nr:DUF983 domain-containing protein [Devosia enhydra]SFZ86120.1 Uncharacterized conserved protein, DUF983 family [Devosia enhydra]
MTGSEPSPILAGLSCRCPRCGQGRLFRGYLKVAPRCERCDLDLAFADSGDGPAIFIIFIVGFLVVALAAITSSLVSLHPLVHLAIWLPVTLALCLALLPPFKGVMIALQYRHGAEEGRPL